MSHSTDTCSATAGRDSAVGVARTETVEEVVAQRFAVALRPLRGELAPELLGDLRDVRLFIGVRRGLVRVDGDLVELTGVEPDELVDEAYVEAQSGRLRG